MTAINWQVTEQRYASKSSEISSHVSGSDWISFMDALGWLENSGAYGGLGGSGNTYAGMYQVGDSDLEYTRFFNDIGTPFFGITTKSEFAMNPLAQDIAAISEFSGIPDPNKVFVSKYTATRSDAKRLYNLSNANFDRMIDRTFVINYVDSTNKVVGTHTIKLSKAGISAAAHLIGQGDMARAINEIYKDCFDANGNLISSTATLPINDFADGSGVAFTNYVRLLQNYDISPLINASEGFNDFNSLVHDLVAHRKQEIINNLKSNLYEVAMSPSSSPTSNDKKYKDTIKAILKGLDLPTTDLEAVDGKVILTGGITTKFTDKSDLIIGLENTNNTLQGGLGNDYLLGGAGTDTYLYTAGDGFDTILDSDNTGIIKMDNITLNGGKQIGDNRVYKDTVNNHTYVQIDPETLIIDGSILIQNYIAGSNKFGLTLAAPADVSPSDRITGNASDNFIGAEIFNRNPSNTDVFEASLPNNVNAHPVSLTGKTLASLIEGGAGHDIINGDSGDDLIFADTQTAIATAIAQGNSQSGTGIKGDWLSGGDGNDTLIGSSDNDVLSGGAGSDLLVGGAGNDFIMGDNNWLAQKFDWTVTLVNGVWEFSPVTGDTFPTDPGNDVIYAGRGDDTVWSGKGNDVIFGEDGNDVLTGNGGNDVIVGGIGNDHLVGDGIQLVGEVENGQGDDYLDGGEGQDVLDGGDGSDVLVGGKDNDILNGGAGRDTYIYRKGDGVDTINDTRADNNIFRIEGGITSDNIKLHLGSLLLDMGDGDQVHIAGFDQNDVFNTSSISSFQFDDGTTLTLAELDFPQFSSQLIMSEIT